MSIGPLKFLHPAESLNKVKLMQIEKLTTEQILASLAPGQGSCLKARSDGTVLDGHHRLQVLLSRGVEINGLARELVPKEGGGDVD